MITTPPQPVETGDPRTGDDAPLPSPDSPSPRARRDVPGGQVVRKPRATRRIRSVALVGPDGAGKSTVARAVVRALGARARYLYMGVNLESSGQMLPTTRIALAFKRARGRGPRITADWGAADPRERGGAKLVARQAYGGIRLLAWLAEEWYRALIARSFIARGYVVVFDRHFLLDYYASHVQRRPGRPFTARVHGRLLDRFYPRPDFVVVLDAPAAVLHERKREQSVESIEARRHEYLAAGSIARDFVIVDATRPADEVARDVTGLIQARLG